MSERVVRAAIDAFMARDLDGILAVADEQIVLRPLLTEAAAATGAGSGAPVDQVSWLGARVEAAKIIFFGFFGPRRTLSTP